MGTEIVLFLRDRVAEAPLQQALADVFGVAGDGGDEPLVVRYMQGFALGISAMCNGISARQAARMLAERVATDVLLETCCDSENVKWLLFSPDADEAYEVQVVELRHGLDVATLVPRTRRVWRQRVAV